MAGGERGISQLPSDKLLNLKGLFRYRFEAQRLRSRRLAYSCRLLPAPIYSSRVKLVSQKLAKISQADGHPPVLPLMDIASLAAELRLRRGMMCAKEVAPLIDMNLDVLYRKLKTGEVPHFRYLGQIKFDPYRLAAWLEEHEVCSVDLMAEKHP